jgi:hypothetical protein
MEGWRGSSTVVRTRTKVFDAAMSLFLFLNLDGSCEVFGPGRIVDTCKVECLNFINNLAVTQSYSPVARMFCADIEAFREKVIPGMSSHWPVPTLSSHLDQVRPVP